MRSTRTSRWAWAASASWCSSSTSAARSTRAGGVESELVAHGSLRRLRKVPGSVVPIQIGVWWWSHHVGFGGILHGWVADLGF